MAISEERAKCERENTVLRVRISDLQAEVEDHAASLLATVIRAEAAEAEVKRLHDLHLERTHLTTRMIKERDAAEAKLAAIEGVKRRNLTIPWGSGPHTITREFVVWSDIRAILDKAPEAT